MWPERWQIRRRRIPPWSSDQPGRPAGRGRYCLMPARRRGVAFPSHKPAHGPHIIQPFPLPVSKVVDRRWPVQAHPVGEPPDRSRMMSKLEATGALPASGRNAVSTGFARWSSSRRHPGDEHGATLPLFTLRVRGRSGPGAFPGLQARHLDRQLADHDPSTAEQHVLVPGQQYGNALSLAALTIRSCMVLATSVTGAKSLIGSYGGVR